MHPRVYQESERICAERDDRGAVPSGETLLCMKSVENVRERIGMNGRPSSLPAAQCSCG